MNEFVFSVDGIGTLVGILLTMLFSYFPELRDWYATQKSYIKSLIMIGLIAISTAVLAFATFKGFIGGGEVLTVDKVIQVFFWTLVANQAGYQILPQLNSVKEKKEEAVG